MTDITRPQLPLSLASSSPRAVLDYVKSRARAQSKDFSNAEQAARVPPCALPKTKKRVPSPSPPSPVKLKLKPYPRYPVASNRRRRPLEQTQLDGSLFAPCGVYSITQVYYVDEDADEDDNPA